MKKIAIALGIIFVILTFVGIEYIVYNRFMVSPGYAIVPMALALICFTVYQSKNDE